MIKSISRIYSKLVTISNVDATTGAVKTIDYPHAEIHSGSFFRYQKYHSLAKAGTKEFLVVTPDTTRWGHFDVHVSSNGGELVYSIYEAATTSSNGTLVNVNNRNRNCPDDNSILIYENPVVTADGTFLADEYFGLFKEAGGDSRDQEEKIYKQNTKYLIRIVEQNVLACKINVSIGFYEHTNRV